MPEDSSGSPRRASEQPSKAAGVTERAAECESEYNVSPLRIPHLVSYRLLTHGPRLFSSQSRNSGWNCEGCSEVTVGDPLWCNLQFVHIYIVRPVVAQCSGHVLVATDAFKLLGRNSIGLRRFSAFVERKLCPAHCFCFALLAEEFEKSSRIQSHGIVFNVKLYAFCVAGPSRRREACAQVPTDSRHGEPNQILLGGAGQCPGNDQPVAGELIYYMRMEKGLLNIVERS